MARTAPVPNIPAIPGMNPGLFVLGGGGDGGGSGAGAGKGKGGKQGANGKNGGKDANGGGKGAGACGAGSGGGCSNPSHGGGGGAAAGDPVDIVTGRVYTIPVIDLAVNGVIPLVLKRSYSTTCAERDIGLGFGWSHSLSWEVEPRRRSVIVWKPDGSYIRAPQPDVGEQVVVEEGVYLSRQDYGYTVATDDGLVQVFQRQEGFLDRIPLSRVLDRAGNAIELTYTNGLLDTIRDSVGRTVRVRRHQDGHIAAFEVKNAETQGTWVSFRRYEYDTLGDLVGVIDGDGHRTVFTYEEHRMTARLNPSGLKSTFLYDASFRCTETWTELPGGADPALDKEAPELLADGLTRARGMLHCKITYGDEGFREVVDSRQVRRYEGNEHGKVDKASWSAGVATSTYDDAGNMTGYTDALGVSWAWKRDAEGRLLEQVDPLGNVTRYEYDAQGNKTAEIDPAGNAVRYAYAVCGRLERAEDDSGVLAAYRYDSRGQLVEAMLPNGGISRIVRDQHGNPVQVVEPNGSSRRMRYDHLGRVVEMTDERGAETRYSYDARGRLSAVHLPNGGVHRYEFDVDGRLLRVTNADGYFAELVWGGFNVVAAMRRPDGHTMRFLHDRECDLVRVVNEAGEEHRLIRDVGGRVIEERTFDGRKIRYGTDGVGRLTLLETAPGEQTELVYDEAGRLVKRVYPEGAADEFEYDAVGRIIAGRNEVSSVEMRYDARGRKVGESIAAFGQKWSVDGGFDTTGRRTAIRTSLGASQQITRDVMGGPVAVALNGTDTVQMVGDVLGRDLFRKLPGGGEIRYELDNMGRPRRRTVLRAGPSAPASLDQPEWVGAQRSTAVSDRVYQYSAAGMPVEELDMIHGRWRYEHDPVGQILSKLNDQMRGELFRYDATGNAHPGTSTRSYGPGGTLLATADTEYVHDDQSRLVEKRVRRGTGEIATWKYTWNDRGMLAAVKLPDGDEVRFLYDAFGRRIRKEHIAPDGARGATTFVWDSESLVHEIREKAAGSGDPIVEERTYVLRPDSLAPLAHRDVKVEGDKRVPGEWIHYLNDAQDRPELLLSGTGELLADLRPTVWGDVAPVSPAPAAAQGLAPSAAQGPAPAAARTPIRYPGQYADDETGLSYNRYRYYDPETGRYISPDPLSLEGGLRPFTYARNSPLREIDPTGLVTNVVTGSAGTSTGVSNTLLPEGSQERNNPDLHPIVRQAMPPNMAEPPGALYPPGTRQPQTCGEPRAMTNYIREWERQNNGGRPLNPDNPRDHEKIRQCMGSIDNVTSTDANGPRRPCPNCSQMLANLNTRWGGPPTNNYGISPGAGGPGDRPVRSNWSRPDQAWLQAAQQNPSPNFTPHVGYGQPAG